MYSEVEIGNYLVTIVVILISMQAFYKMVKEKVTQTPPAVVAREAAPTPPLTTSASSVAAAAIATPPPPPPQTVVVARKATATTLSPPLTDAATPAEAAVATPSPPVTAENSSSATTTTGRGGGAEYEVFLSFRGEDTRKTFTDFLYTYLVNARVRTFRDNENLRVGEEIGPELIKAIKDSKICIPVFSKNYASSKWCLHEIAHMVKCSETDGKTIFPIFYDVNPYDVRHQTGSYEEPFSQHEKKFPKTTVQEWREALQKVAQLKGLELSKETDGHEGELVEKVVKTVFSKLKKNQTSIPEILVGMDHHEEKMKELLGENFDGLRIIVIHGMDGIGKTTIARVIYNQLCDGFDRCCFLEDVKETLRRPNGIYDLQYELLSDIIKGKFPDVNLNRIKDAVRGKKVLIVVDDVDEKLDLDNLLGVHDSYGLGSRIIITTRNKELLNKLEDNYKKIGLLEVCSGYEPGPMNPVDALELFQKCAFLGDSPPKDFDQLCKELVSTAGGLPLVLKVVGSSLAGEERKDFWKEKLRKLKKIPEKEVMEKLRTSLEGLSDEAKQIFLDIACFLVGKHLYVPYHVWDGCKFYPDTHLHYLIMRSLVKRGDTNILWMHDQLRALGRQIVIEESFNYPGERSRLWDPEDALKVFEGHTGTQKVLALSLDFRHTEWHTEPPPDGLVRENFEKLPNLRYLKVKETSFVGEFKNVFPNLVWLKCRIDQLNLGKEIHLRSLVVLDLSRSKMTTLDWERSGIKQIKLKVLILKKCPMLTTTPTFGKGLALKALVVSRCRSLHEIHPSISEMTTLRSLIFQFCRDLQGTLDVSTLSSITFLDIRGTKIRGVDGINQLKWLTYFKASECECLESLPNLSNLKHLRELAASECVKLMQIEGLEELICLKRLDISGCKLIEKLPDFSNLGNLEVMKVADCVKLTELRGLEELKSLRLLDVTGCKSIKNVPNFPNKNIVRGATSG